MPKKKETHQETKDKLDLVRETSAKYYKELNEAIKERDFLHGENENNLKVLGETLVGLEEKEDEIVYLKQIVNKYIKDLNELKVNKAPQVGLGMIENALTSEANNARDLKKQFLNKALGQVREAIKI